MDIVDIANIVNIVDVAHIVDIALLLHFIQIAIIVDLVLEHPGEPQHAHEGALVQHDFLRH